MLCRGGGLVVSVFASDDPSLNLTGAYSLKRTVTARQSLLAIEICSQPFIFIPIGDTSKVHRNKANSESIQLEHCSFLNHKFVLTKTSVNFYCKNKNIPNWYSCLSLNLSLGSFNLPIPILVCVSSIWGYFTPIGYLFVLLRCQFEIGRSTKEYL